MSQANTKVLIIGTGFAGIGMGIRLMQAGFHDFIIVERADAVGGTWRDNRYPGAACDIESHLYSFSFEPNPNWSRQFAPQSEILAYLEHCVEKYGLTPHIRFGIEVKSATFHEADGEWQVDTSTGSLRAKMLVSGCGGLSKPALPDIPGLATFAGKTMHTARWDEAHSLAGKRVGVIGTGASAVQVVPAIVAEVGHLDIFQRTAPWITPKPDRPLRSIERTMFRRAPWLQQLARTSLYWRHELLAFGFVVEPRLLRLAEPLVRKFLTDNVSDPVLREKLRPNYALGCKRVLPANDYYAAVQQSQVELVTEGITAVEPAGVRSGDGRLHALDTLILATGFEAAEAVAPFPVRGRGGRDLTETWRAGAEAYLGTAISGFPNLFLIVGPNTGLGHSSMIFMIEAQVHYIVEALRTLTSKKLRFVDLRAERQREYNQRLHQRLAARAGTRRAPAKTPHCGPASPSSSTYAPAASKLPTTKSPDTTTLLVAAHRGAAKDGAGAKANVRAVEIGLVTVDAEVELGAAACFLRRCRALLAGSGAAVDCAFGTASAEGMLGAVLDGEVPAKTRGGDRSGAGGQRGEGVACGARSRAAGHRAGAA